MTKPKKRSKTNADATPQLLFDSARTALEHDEFNFRDLGKRLAISIADLLAGPKRDSSFVLGIEGSWGSGKSSILNYVKDELAATLSGQNYYLIDFDPWWLEEGANVAASLLMSVLGTLPKTEAKKTLAAMGYLASAAGKLPPGIGAILKISKRTEGLGELLEGVQQAGGDIDTILNAAKPTRKLRDEVSKAFKEGGYKFIVFIDDLDRLSPSQALQVMSAIRSIADLPGFVYVLAYDAAALENILEHSTPPLGPDYFEKIVNISIPVPPVTADQMKNFLMKMLNALLTRALRDRSADVHLLALIELLEAPRHAVRLANAVNFWIGTKTDEVFLPDFVLLEAVRLAHPQAYAGLIRTSDIWISNADDDGLSGILSKNESERAAKKAKIVARVERELRLTEAADHAKIKGALSALFPKAAQYLGSENGFYFGSLVSDERKIENRRHFFTYFLHRPIPGAATKSEVEALLAPKIPYAARTKLLKSLTSRPAADVDPTDYLLAVIDAGRQAGTVSKAVDLDLVRGLANLASGVKEEPDGYLMSAVDVTRNFAGRAFNHWTTLTDAEVATIFDPSLSISMLAALHLVLTAGTTYYLLDDPGNQRVANISDAALKQITAQFGGRLLAGIPTGEIFDGMRVPRLIHMAYKYDPATTIAALAPMFADDKMLVAFLEQFVGYSYPTQHLPTYFGDTLFALRGRIERAMHALNLPPDAWHPWQWVKDVAEDEVVP